MKKVLQWVAYPFLFIYVAALCIYLDIRYPITEENLRKWNKK